MTLLWTSPRTFIAGKALTASQMNEISNNASYLYTRPNKICTIRGTGANYTTVSTTFVDVDAVLLGGSLETSGGMLEINILGTVSNTAIATVTCFDVFMDNTTYLSSLTATALTNGIWQHKAQQVTYQDSIRATPYRIEIGGVAAGVHTFTLRWRATANTSTLYTTAGNLLQFSIVEHS